MLSHARFSTVGFAAALMGSVLSGQAQSAVFDSVGDSYSSPFIGLSDPGGAVVPGLTADFTVTLTGVVGNAYTFSYLIDNTSTAPVTSSRISGFGFRDSDPEIPVGGATVSGTFTNAVLNGNYPVSFGHVDFCASNANGQGCSGPGGVTQTGPNGTGTFTLSFLAPTPSVTLTDFVLRFQSLAYPGVTDGSGIGVPVPGPLAGAGLPALLALGGFAWMRRRRA